MKKDKERSRLLKKKLRRIQRDLEKATLHKRVDSNATTPIF